MINSLATAVINYPGSFGCWAFLLQFMVYGFNEIAITGKNAKNFMTEIINYYIPDKIIQTSEKENNEFPLLKEKWKVETVIYLCRIYICNQPVKTVNDLLRLLEAVRNSK